MGEDIASVIPHIYNAISSEQYTIYKNNADMEYFILSILRMKKGNTNILMCKMTKLCGLAFSLQNPIQ